MRSRSGVRATALAVALLGGIVGARAQDAPPPEAEAPAAEDASPIDDASPVDEAPPADEVSGPADLPPPAVGTTAPGQAAADAPPGAAPPGPGFGVGRLQARFVWQDYRLEVEADDVRGPFGTRPANRRIDYDLRKTSMRFELGYGLGNETIELDLYGGLGWGFTDLSLEGKPGSLVAGAGPTVQYTASTDADFDLSLGLDLWAFVADHVFVGAGYQFLYSHGEFDNQLFYGVDDGVLDLTIHDLTLLRVGARFDVVSFWAGFGFVFVAGDLDLDQRGGPGRWDVDLGSDDPAFIKGLLGAAIHPGENFVGRFELAFLPDPSFFVSLGWSF